MSWFLDLLDPANKHEAKGPGAAHSRHPHEPGGAKAPRVVHVSPLVATSAVVALVVVGGLLGAAVKDCDR